MSHKSQNYYYRAVNVPIIVIDILYLIQHFHDHQKSNYSGDRVRRAYLNVSSRIDYDNCYQDEYEINSADLKPYRLNR